MSGMVVGESWGAGRDADDECEEFWTERVGGGGPCFELQIDGCLADSVAERGTEFDVVCIDS